MMYFKLFLLLLLLYSATGFARGCDQVKADDLVLRALHLGHGDLKHKKRLLKEALRYCSSHPEALNNLGVVYENQGNLSQALSYYRKALKVRANFANAWIGVGDVYQKQGQLPLALDAYLNACADQDAKQKVMALLKGERYRSVEAGQVLNKASLLALYDPARHQAILKKTEQCGFKARSSFKPIGVFRNLHFQRGSAKVTKSSMPQLMEIAVAISSLSQNVQIDGHSDKRPFKGYSQKESDRKNRALSLRRAKAIKKILVQQGIDRERIYTTGYGPDRPLVLGNSKAAYAKNRRVEISFQE